MTFVPPPLADDVEGDFGPYSRDEIIAARACLLHTVQRETSYEWQCLKSKMGILANGKRLRINTPEHEWIPAPLPPLWSAPVALYDPQTGLCVETGHSRVQVELQKQTDSDNVTKSDDEQREREGGEALSTAGSSSATYDPSSVILGHHGSGQTGTQSAHDSNTPPKVSQSSSTDQRSGQKRSLQDSEEQEELSTSYKDSTAIAYKYNTSKRQKSSTVAGSGREQREEGESGISTTTETTTTMIPILVTDRA